VSRTGLAALVLALPLAFACQYTAQDIEEWKATRKGPGKIVAVLQAEKYPVELRVRAAMALIEMNREDVQPLRELGRAFQRITVEDRVPLISAMVPQIEAALRAPATERGPSPVQVRAKDAAFLLLDFSTGAERVRLEDALLSWLTADLNNRWMTGENSADKIVRQVGARAARALVATMTPDQAAIVQVAGLIKEVGDAEAKAAASTQLVQVATAQAGLPRGVREPTLEAMMMIGGRPIVEWALALALVPPPAEEAARRQFAQVQVFAIRAIKQHILPTDLDRLFAIATNASLPSDLRDEGFERISDLRTPDAVPKLWPLLESDDERVRWRAGDLILSSGGPSVVRELLTKLPAGRTEYPERETGSYVDAIAAMNPVPLDQVRPLLVAESWISRYLAVRVVALRGSRQDVPILQQLVGDRTRIPGREPAVSIGDEARRAVERLQGG